MKTVKKKSFGKYNKNVLKENHVPMYSWGGGFSGATTGALQGAGMGSMFGPWGTAIGAGVGAITGAYTGSTQEDEQKKQMLLQSQQMQNNPYATYRYGGRRLYPMGGINRDPREAGMKDIEDDNSTSIRDPRQQESTGIANAELEKQENVRYPNGETQQFDGPSHEKSGIPVNLPNQTEIFSDKLKVPGEKKLTFADLAKKYRTDKFKKIQEDPNSTKLAKDTADRMFNKNNSKLSEIFDLQERLKAIRQHQDALKQAGNDAIEQYRNGGKVRKYDGGGLTPNYNTYMNQEGLANKNFPMGPEYDGYRLDSQNMNPIPTNSQVYPTPNGLPIQDNQFNYSPSFGNKPEVTPNSSNQPNWGQIGQSAAITGLNALEPAMYLAQQGKSYDKVNYPTLNPSLVNYDASRRDANREAMVTRNNLASATGGNSGAYLGNSSAVMSANTQNQANITQAEQQANTGIRNSASQFNIQNKIGAMRDEAANKGRAQENYFSSIGRLGTVGAQGINDYQNNQMDNKKLGLLKNMFPDFDFNDKNWQYKFVKSYGKTPQVALEKNPQGYSYGNTYNYYTTKP